MRDHRHDAGTWNWLAGPLTIVVMRGVALAFFVAIVAEGREGAARAFSIGVAVAVFAILVTRDIRRRRSRDVDSARSDVAFRADGSETS